MLDRDSFELVREWTYRREATGRSSVPKLVRKILARTTIHRAWLQGKSGSFLVSVLER